MVDGVRGYVSHVVRHVVMEQGDVIEDVIILDLPVEEVIVLAQVLLHLHALLTILVRSSLAKTRPSKIQALM